MKHGLSDGSKVSKNTFLFLLISYLSLFGNAIWEHLRRARVLKLGNSSVNQERDRLCFRQRWRELSLVRIRQRNSDNQRPLPFIFRANCQVCSFAEYLTLLKYKNEWQFPSIGNLGCAGFRARKRPSNVNHEGSEFHYLACSRKWKHWKDNRAQNCQVFYFILLAEGLTYKIRRWRFKLKIDVDPTKELGKRGKLVLQKQQKPSIQSGGNTIPVSISHL